jgi:membrane-associated phospholipid phosphatase
MRHGEENVIDLRPGSPLIAPAARRWAFALMACCGILVAVLGVLFAHQARPDSFDRAVDSPIISWFGGHQGLSLWLAGPGSTIPATVLCAALVLGCLLTRRTKGAVLAGLALPLAVGLDDGVLKHLVHRTYLGQLTYPSGHTTAIVTIGASAAVLFLGPQRPARAAALRLAIPAIACLLAVAVAVGVIGLQWHYFTDTVAGAAVSIGTVCGVALGLDLAFAYMPSGGTGLPVPPLARGSESGQHGDEPRPH